MKSILISFSIFLKSYFCFFLYYISYTYNNKIKSDDDRMYLININVTEERYPFLYIRSSYLTLKFIYDTHTHIHVSWCMATYTLSASFCYHHLRIPFVSMYVLHIAPNNNNNDILNHINYLTNFPFLVPPSI